MASDVILLQSMGGTNFSLQPGQLVECNPDEAERFLETGTARKLVKGEPTAIQEASKFSFVEQEKRLKKQAESEEQASDVAAPAGAEGETRVPARRRASKTK
jgi:hypothetical protein